MTKKNYHTNNYVLYWVNFLGAEDSKKYYYSVTVHMYFNNIPEDW